MEQDILTKTKSPDIKVFVEEITDQEIREFSNFFSYQAGVEFFKMNMLSEIQFLEPETIKAVFKGFLDIETEVCIENLHVFAKCTCTTEEKGACKHIVALILHAKEEIRKN